MTLICLLFLVFGLILFRKVKIMGAACMVVGVFFFIVACTIKGSPSAVFSGDVALCSTLWSKFINACISGIEAISEALHDAFIGIATKIRDILFRIGII